MMDVHYDVRAIAMKGEPTGEFILVDVYGGPAAVCGVVTLRLEDAKNAVAMVKSWIEDETPLAIIAHNGRVVVQTMEKLRTEEDLIRGWGMG